LFLDDRIGSIEVGKDADIAIGDRDPYTAPTDSLKDMRCELTLFGGISSIAPPLETRPGNPFTRRAIAALKGIL
jgi:cytosine/adenosine deaminase-related metal-dependent hydrolase